MRVCSGAGCLRAVPDDQQFCSECRSPDTKSHSYAARDSKIAGLYSKKRWQQTSQRQLHDFPICDLCHASLAWCCDHVIPATIAIAQVAADPRSKKLWPYDWQVAGFYLPTNHQSLCRSCHKKKTDADTTRIAAGLPWPNILDAREAKTRIVCDWVAL